MSSVPINYVAVLVAAVASMIIGALWYGPLFGKTWMRLSGMSSEMMMTPEKKQQARRGYLISFVGLLVMAYVLAHLVNLLFVVDLSGAWELSFWLWLGLFVPSQLSPVLWEGKPVKVYFINVFHYLVSLYAMIAVLVWWV